MATITNPFGRINTSLGTSQGQSTGQALAGIITTSLGAYAKVQEIDKKFTEKQKVEAEKNDNIAYLGEKLTLEQKWNEYNKEPKTSEEQTSWLNENFTEEKNKVFGTDEYKLKFSGLKEDYIGAINKNRKQELDIKAEDSLTNFASSVSSLKELNTLTDNLRDLKPSLSKTKVFASVYRSGENRALALINKSPDSVLNMSEDEFGKKIMGELWNQTKDERYKDLIRDKYNTYKASHTTALNKQTKTTIDNSKYVGGDGIDEKRLGSSTNNEDLYTIGVQKALVTNLINNNDFATLALYANSNRTIVDENGKVYKSKKDFIKNQIDIRIGEALDGLNNIDVTNPKGEADFAVILKRLKNAKENLPSLKLGLVDSAKEIFKDTSKGFKSINHYYQTLKVMDEFDNKNSDTYGIVQASEASITNFIANNKDMPEQELVSNINRIKSNEINAIKYAEVFGATQLEKMSYNYFDERMDSLRNVSRYVALKQIRDKKTIDKNMTSSEVEDLYDKFTEVYQQSGATGFGSSLLSMFSESYDPVRIPKGNKKIVSALNNTIGKTVTLPNNKELTLPNLDSLVIDVVDDNHLIIKDKNSNGILLDMDEKIIDHFNTYKYDEEKNKRKNSRRR